MPAELHKAKVALEMAEKSFEYQPDSYVTRDLAYVADRKAKIAEGLANSAAEKASTEKANKDYKEVQTEILSNTKKDLAASEKAGVIKTEQLTAEQNARIDAERRTSKAQEDLANLAAVKGEARGLVITLSGSVLFASNESALLPAAQEKLNQVANALMQTKEKRITVEGHTDSQGVAVYNQVLSLKRADAVRYYIISRGYPGDLIRAVGIGEDRPIAGNASAEGRANNRRVEIVIEHTAQ